MFSHQLTDLLFLLIFALPISSQSANAQSKARDGATQIHPSGIYGFSWVRNTPPSEEMEEYASPKFMMTIKSAKSGEILKIATVPEQGEFTLTLLPGEYLVHIEPVRYSVEQICLGLNYQFQPVENNEFKIKTWKGFRTALVIYFDAG